MKKIVHFLTVILFTQCSTTSPVCTVTITNDTLRPIVVTDMDKSINTLKKLSPEVAEGTPYTYPITKAQENITLDLNKLNFYIFTEQEEKVPVGSEVYIKKSFNKKYQVAVQALVPKNIFGRTTTGITPSKPCIKEVKMSDIIANSKPIKKSTLKSYTIQ